MPLRPRRLFDAGLGRADGVGARGAEVQQLVERRRDHGTGERADVPDPAVRPVVADELRAERARRVHRAAGQAVRHQDVERDREADREAGDLLERAARVDRGREHDPDEEERQHRLDHDAGAGADAGAERGHAEVRRGLARRSGAPT